MPRLIGAGHERLAERILPVHRGDGEIAVASAISVVALADAPLQPLEIGQHIRIAPAAITELRPGVEILALAAIVDVAVDRGRAAERLAARRIDAAAAGPGPRLLLVGPVDALHVEGLDEAGRQMDVGVPVAGPASSRQMLVPASSLSRLASTQPAEPRQRSHNRMYPSSRFRLLGDTLHSRLFVELIVRCAFTVGHSLAMMLKTTVSRSVPFGAI